MEEIADTKIRKRAKKSGKDSKNGSKPGGNRIILIIRAIGDWFVKLFSSIGKWFVRAANAVMRIFRRIGEAWDKKVSPKVKKYVSPVFVTILIICFLMWYFLKLGESYTSARVPITIDIEGRDVRLNVYATGTGYKLLNIRYSNHRELTFKWSDLEVTPSVDDPRVVIISPDTVRERISQNYPDLVITSVQIPGIEL